MKTAPVAFALVALFLSACSEKPKSADYYFQHQDEMRKVLDECKNKAISPFADSTEARNCRAAAEADNKRYFNSGACQ